MLKILQDIEKLIVLYALGGCLNDFWWMSSTNATYTAEDFYYNCIPVVDGMRLQE